LIIGGGPAGLSAAIRAKEEGIKSVAVIERSTHLGGILNQCIHHGFGIHIFKEELTGPEYAHRFVARVNEMGIEYKISAMVLGITQDKTITVASETEGLILLKAEAVVLAMGCRERPRGALDIAGTRPSGVFSAGAVQKMINIGGLHVGEKIVILGSGDVGMIVARRLKLEGKQVLAVVERLPHAGGLLRNKIQCLDDFNIPLLASHTIVEILGKYRVNGVVICPLDKKGSPIRNKSKTIECDTLIISVGLIPETELARDLGLAFNKCLIAVNEELQTSLPWVFACGNVLFVHDLVDDVTMQSLDAGRFAADYILNKKSDDSVMTQTQQKKDTALCPNLRLKADEMICTLCPAGCVMKLSNTQDGIAVENNACEKGKEFAISELQGPKRHLTSTIALNNNPTNRLPIRTTKPVPKDKIPQIMEKIRSLNIIGPVAYHQVLIPSVAGCESDIIASTHS
jgi:NADPH-dependent 2,4-dienoyl-CoA reductase/sulfur reductase-like enzyme/CxxC motif-containing protein